jgi:hypothetical protein
VAEIGRIVVQGQIGQIVCDNPFRSIAGSKGTYLSSQDIWEAEIGRIMVSGHFRQKKNFVRVHFREKNVGVVVHVCHPSYYRKHKLRGL